LKKKLEEKRASQRHCFKTSARFAYFNQKNFHAAELLGFSEGGISFYSRTPIKAGATILIKLEELSSDLRLEKGWPGLKTISLVETRWCRDVGGLYVPEYEIGAKFVMWH